MSAALLDQQCPAGIHRGHYAAAVGELGQADLDELVEEAIVDAHDEDEQLAGFCTMIEESLALPFTTRVLGLG